MSKIKILPQSVYNKIAAGEVVERPASVVKELVENSIDSGARKIGIFIKGCGLESIAVADDGSGIAQEDVRKAFLPHATSKIRKADDLMELRTLGFRGEALASIASVSHLIMWSKVKEADYGVKIMMMGGNVISESFSAGPECGTKIEVNNLFYNIPARKKFLKRPSGEVAEITNIVIKMILSNPFISFRYAIDDQDVFVTNGMGLEEAVYALYGRKALEQCFRIENEYKDVSVSGLVGEPTLLKPNTTSQTVIVNGRYVKDDTISIAVKNAFNGLTMRREYPFFIIEVTLPADMIDVNVHPNKMEVRYSNKNDVYRAVYHPIRTHLTNEKLIMMASSDSEKIQKFTGFDGLNIEQVKIDEVEVPDISALAKAEKEELEKPDTTQPEGVARFDSTMQIRAHAITDKLEKHDYDRIIDYPTDVPYMKTARYTVSDTDNIVPVVDDRPCRVEVKYENFFVELKKLVKQSEEEEAKNPETIFGRCTTLGYVFDDYILAETESGDAMLIIDQHAAHERILYDRYLRLLDSSEVTIQQIFTPFVFNVTEEQIKMLEMMHSKLHDYGFDYHISEGDKLIVDGVPGHFSNIDMCYFFNSLFQDNEYSLDLNDLNKFYIAKKACHAAIKGGMEITLKDIRDLLFYLDEHKDLKCPHGRPVALAIKKSIFDKAFKRQ